MDEWIDLSLMITACGFSAVGAFVVGYALGWREGWNRASSYYASCNQDRANAALKSYETNSELTKENGLLRSSISEALDALRHGVELLETAEEKV